MCRDSSHPGMSCLSSPFESELARILRDPAASHWLKNALQAAARRDPVDALADAECLVRLLESHVKTLLTQPSD